MLSYQMQGLCQRSLTSHNLTSDNAYVEVDWSSYFLNILKEKKRINPLYIFRLMGSYEALRGGCAAEAMEDFWLVTYTIL